MCGIAGVLSPEDSASVTYRMVAAMHHRGPDDSGIHVIDAREEQIALGNTRLAIIDLSRAGHMPMCNPGTGDWITYNGEIYNFPELRRQLESRGSTFQSNSDTEVILKAYEVWGTGCLSRLRGMFAFALWDAQHGELLLARDRLGEKPLYYLEDRTRGRFLFASEIRTLLASDLVEKRLDQAALRIYLYNGFTVAPGTMIQGVRSLLPGHWMRVGADGIVREISRYWCVPSYQGSESSANEEDIRETLAEAVRIRLISDVPLGAFLSGGLDSSLVVALMARAAGEVRTFSIGFHERHYDESPYAAWVARKFNTNHTSILLSPQDFAAWLENGLGGMDQPTFDGLNTYFVSRAVRECGLKVALSGLGGDELFGGYPFFKSARFLARLGPISLGLPEASRRRIASTLGHMHGVRKAFHLFGDPIPPGMELLAAYQTSLSLFPQLAQTPLLADKEPRSDVWFGLPAEFVDSLVAEGRDADILSLLSKYTLRLFEGERLLRDSDSMSMAVSLEVRTAFTDHILIEKVWNTPGRVRCAGAPDKPFQVQMGRPILGQDYPARRKRGFTFPFQEWLKSGETHERIETTLQDASLAEAAGLEPSGTAAMSGFNPRLPWSRAWAVFVLMDWARRNGVSS